jgi:hypothetical protein
LRQRDREKRERERQVIESGILGVGPDSGAIQIISVFFMLLEVNI